MGFLFGLLVGTALTSGGDNRNVLAPMADVPLRCYAALDDGDAAFKDCRRLSMVFQITQQYSNSPDRISGVNRDNLKDVVEKALDLELRAMRQIEAASKTKSAQR